MTTARGVSKVRKSLQKVYEELNAEEFIYIDRGVAIVKHDTHYADPARGWLS
mgnify:CR=1 FL=1